MKRQLILGAQAVENELSRQTRYDCGWWFRDQDRIVLFPGDETPQPPALRTEVAPSCYGRGKPLPNWHTAGQYEDEAFVETGPIPVIQLTRIQYDKYPSQFAPATTGFYAFFCGELASPQISIAITGKLLAEDRGSRRAITAADLRNWSPKEIVNRVYTGRGVNASTSWVTRIRADGSFTTESMIALDRGTPRIHILLTLTLKGGEEITADAVFERNDLRCFFTLTDAFEGRLPVKLVTHDCHDPYTNDPATKDDCNCLPAKTPLEFLSTVRKMFQPAPGSPLASLFDIFLHRNRKICRLMDTDSPLGTSIRRYENLQIGNDVVDIGHVLVGIEASRRQKPNSRLPLPAWDDATTEVYMTWVGDLGSALEPYAEMKASGRTADLQWYLDSKASRPDLLGDIDGINIGATYVDTWSLSENLRAYYEAQPFRRFHNFLDRALDGSGKPMFSLLSRDPPVIAPASRSKVDYRIAAFAFAVATVRNRLAKLTEPQKNQFVEMLVVGSKEINAIVDYFFNFLEKGLAIEGP